MLWQDQVVCTPTFLPYELQSIKYIWLIYIYIYGLRPLSFEVSIVLYITPIYASSMQKLIMQGMQQKLQKSCFRIKKKTWHVKSKCVLQHPKYLIIIVNRFRFINNNVTKDRCSIPIDMTIVLDLHKFSLLATYLCILIIILPLSTVARKHSIGSGL